MYDISLRSRARAVGSSLALLRQSSCLFQPYRSESRKDPSVVSMLLLLVVQAACLAHFHVVLYRSKEDNRLELAGLALMSFHGSSAAAVVIGLCLFVLPALALM